MAKIKDLHRVWSTAPAYQGAYDALDDEFRLARVLIHTRSRAGLSQAGRCVHPRRCWSVWRRRPARTRASRSSLKGCERRAR